MLQSSKSLILRTGILTPKDRQLGLGSDYALAVVYLHGRGGDAGPILTHLINQGKK